MRQDLKDLPPEKLAALERTMDMLENDMGPQTIPQTAQKEEKPPDTECEDPDWFDGKKVDETAFGRHLLSLHPLKCLNGVLYDVNGIINEQRLQKEIYDMVTPYIKSGVAKTVSRLLDAVKISAFCEELPLQTDRIHVANGTLHLDGTFSWEKQFCRNRLPVRYVPDAPAPEIWLRFLSELLEEDDIPTLQEFMGYILIPSNKAQKMMLITGNGGEASRG